MSAIRTKSDDRQVSAVSALRDLEARMPTLRGKETKRERGATMARFLSA
jgi:hypothetical protein